MKDFLIICLCIPIIVGNSIFFLNKMGISY